MLLLRAAVEVVRVEPAQVEQVPLATGTFGRRAPRGGGGHRAMMARCLASR